MERKAQSEIITTILLILIVLAAVVVVWLVINQFLKVPTAQCTEVKLSIAGVDAATNVVRVNRLAGGANVVVSDVKVAAGGTVTSLGGTIGELETKPVDTTPQFDIVSGTTVEVAAVIKNSNGEDTTCPVTDRIKVA